MCVDSFAFVWVCLCSLPDYLLLAYVSFMSISRQVAWVDDEGERRIRFIFVGIGGVSGKTQIEVAQEVLVFDCQCPIRCPTYVR